MADTIRLVLEDIETKIEALTPVTDSSRTFRAVTGFVFSGDHDEIPEAIAHRMFTFDVESSDFAKDISGKAAWNLILLLSVFHVWKRAPAKEARIIRAEDVQVIHSCFHYQRPGSAAGARWWTKESEDVARDGDRWRTNITYTGQLWLDAALSP